MKRLVGEVGIKTWMFIVFALGLLNAAAVYSLAVYSWGWPGLVAIIVVAALVFFRLHIALTPLAVWGMISEWNWPWWLALLVALWPLVLWLVFLGGFGLLGSVNATAKRE